MKKPVMLIVLDGWGYREETEDNAIAKANTPNFDRLWAEFPHTLLKASGEAVGLPEGQMGTSEVGHTIMGAGTIVDTDLVRINKDIETGKFAENEVLKKTFEKAKESTLHLMGLVSDGGVHSSQEHLHEILRLAKKNGIDNIKIHVFTDGRDCNTDSGVGFVKKLEEVGIGEIATLSGRYYAMDRDHNWERTEKAYQAIFYANEKKSNLKASEEVENQYKNGVTDEYIEPVVFDGYEGVKENDAILFFNFRTDRARQLSKKILNHHNVYFASMVQYDDDFSNDVLYPEENIEETLAGVISRAGLKQSHLAETEKFAHVTYFFNGGRENAYPGEDQIIVHSRQDVKTHDEAPEMRADEITEKVLEEIKKGQDFILVNFANADMVGHTGNAEATIKAVETIDRELGRIIEALGDGVALITADHGNAEFNAEEHTSHSISPVPAIITQSGYTLKNDQGLASVAPTILKLLGLEKPKEMDAASLIE